MAKSTKSLSDLLHDLIEWGGKADRAASRTDRTSVAEDEMAELALARAVEIVGEISGRLLTEYPDRWTEGERVQLRGAYVMRNRLAHGYDAISPEILFDVATDKVAALAAKARRWLAELDDDQP